MLIRLFLNIFPLLLKIVLWVVITFAIIPLGIFILFLHIFPDLATDADFRFWAFFAFLNIFTCYFLWKPIHWIISTITAMGEGVQVTERI